MSDVIDKKLGDKLQKLLARASDKRGNEHEAAMAMEMAQQLMAKHNITMAELEASGQSSGEEGRRSDTRSAGRALYEYQRHLMMTIAQSNFCLCFLTEIEVETRQEAWDAGRSKPRNRKGYQLIGRESNVVSTKNMFDYLNETMERLVPIASNSERLGKKAISWKTGCAERLGQRVKQKAQEMEAESLREAEQRRQEWAARRAHPGYTPENAIVISLVDVRRREDWFNDDMRYGLPLGTHERQDAERQARWATPEYKAQQAALRAKWAAEAEKERLRQEAMTPAQKAKKAREEEAADKRRRRYWDAKAQREQAKRNRLDEHSYYQGAATAEEISLDDQIAEERRKELS